MKHKKKSAVTSLYTFLIYKGKLPLLFSLPNQYTNRLRCVRNGMNNINELSMNVSVSFLHSFVHRRPKIYSIGDRITGSPGFFHVRGQVILF